MCPAMMSVFIRLTFTTIVQRAATMCLLCICDNTLTPADTMTFGCFFCCAFPY